MDAAERRGRLTPNLRYRDVDHAQQWLCEMFGFSRHFEVRGADGVVHAQLRFGDDLVYLGVDVEDDPYDLHSPIDLAVTSQNVCVALADPDAHYDRCVARGVTIVAPIHDTPFGAREYTCRDLEGHVWTFGDYWGEP